ncbi:7-cyano-7-deazaguanine synthase [Bradyrhizobium sp. 157]|uniref:7-cyano-7-deazaguanine synthase n=1 Tax=Bradyrhizobium sp. 157 TaxID=2782631 RepID=UPI001FFA3C36|nr:7-cyano-7-deazaguanine synthase [Bradyrhizobium sp. 157]MCK1640182.1 7-cyano-7-deazaguanine synthase [Bradyrhizobium sp. 157]
MNIHAYNVQVPERGFDVIDSGRKLRKGRVRFDLDGDLEFSTRGLESYTFSRWRPVLYDAMVVAAAVEFADKTVKRPPRGWARRLNLRIPVHDPRRWAAPAVSDALHDAIGFLTGDFWTITFVKRLIKASPPAQERLELGVPTEAVIAYSEGMDSRAVAGIMGCSLGDKLVRVRVGSNAVDHPSHLGEKEPFATVPYKVKSSLSNRETSARSRGFKFTLISGLAAYLAEANKVFIPESGQGSLGPALVTVSHAYPDYRNHPLFTRRMERFMTALLRTPLRYEFPRIWNTKGETLREFVDSGIGDAWASTRSCWRNSQWASLEGKRRQCGACAACMLRRLSVHAAGLTEDPEIYICKDMNAPSVREAVDPRFKHCNAAFEQYALGGVLHLDDLAAMAGSDEQAAVRRHAVLLAPAMNLNADIVERNVSLLLTRHAVEWKSYLKSLGPNSFVKKWTQN